MSANSRRVKQPSPEAAGPFARTARQAPDTVDPLHLPKALASAHTGAGTPASQSARVPASKFQPGHAATIVAGQQVVPETSLDRPVELTTEAHLLQCDLREILTSALLAADLLCRHSDPMVVKRAETVVSGIMQVIERVG